MTDVYQQWLQHDQLLFTWLLYSLYESILPRVLGCRHSWQIWEKLHRYFHSHLKAKVHQRRSKLKTTKKETRYVSEYVLILKVIVDSLAATHDSVPECNTSTSKFF